MEEASLNLLRTALPSWFSPETGIYVSKHPPRNLPQNPFCNIVSYIFSHQHSGTTALIDSQSGFSISYTELHDLVHSMASGLHQLGVSKNQVVLLCLPNSVFYPVILLGVLTIGAIATTLSPLSSFEEIKKQMSRCELTLVFATKANVRKFDSLGVRIIAVPENPNFDPQAFPLFRKLITSDPKMAPKPLIKQTDTAVLLFSSGTSGQSKGVILTHRNLISMVELFVRFEASLYARDPWKNVYLAVVPMFHVYGLSLFAIGLYSLGTTVVVLSKYNVDDTIRAIGKFEVTHFPVVPPLFGVLVRAKKATGCTLKSLLQVQCGAAPLRPSIIEEFLKAFPHVDLIQGYGMTECTAVATRGFNTEKFKKYTSVGLLAPNMEAKVVDDLTGLPLPPGKNGELWLRGPAIMKGYLQDEAAKCLAINRDGWLKTGDIAHFDQDGYVHILDRLKDTIKYKGFQMAPADLEAVLITHPQVQDCAVASAEEEQSGEIPVAFVVRSAGSVLTEERVMEYVNKQVAPYKRVRKVVFVSSIPRSEAGKILRRVLKSNLQSISKL